MRGLVGRIFGTPSRESEPAGNGEDLEAGRGNQPDNAAGTAATQPTVAHDPLNYGRELYFGPRFTGVVEADEDLGRTAWRRVGSELEERDDEGTLDEDADGTFVDGPADDEGDSRTSGSVQQQQQQQQRKKKNWQRKRKDSKPNKENNTGCTELRGLFNVRDITLVHVPAKEEANTSADEAETDAVDETSPPSGRFRLHFCLDLLANAKLTVMWLAREDPQRDTANRIAIRQRDAPMSVPAAHVVHLAEGLSQDYQAPDEHLLSPAELPDQQSLILHALPRSNVEECTSGSADAALEGPVNSVLTRMATAMSLTDRPPIDASAPPPAAATDSPETVVTSDVAVEIQMRELEHPGSKDMPLLILLEAGQGTQSLLTVASLLAPLQRGVNKMTILGQKLRTGGETYLLEQIYGADESATDAAENQGTDGEVESSDCVVCIADPATVAVLPCRHLCLCADCAEELRNRSCFCPICRQAFHTMLRVGE
ncbi:hypothetical protein THASP1DRAFT_28905 [Thamnocephalis sphaerospora]|uniref:RING-type domain-containing protein n=1 Tax=Thamnocephalis sphaerospora TaxID=78915 RepID=A0A4P9XUP3_9FUNG|nr:hypothetical protein THASP1DRAFT_28905 [Thamnocephalis sphaerospora]|eukprot:RKP09301.1 hypothetical protein THASP1DRAFT_28905 [Thamnocephalis sphaerospora]